MKRLLTALLLSFSTAAYGGSIRYELPNLLGDHAYDGSIKLFNAAQVVDTPFRYDAVEEARLVVSGRVRPGKVRGDGTIREATESTLLPSVKAQPNFADSSEFQTEPTPEAFRLETLYSNPFVPETPPLPSPDGYPPVVFMVTLSVAPYFGNHYPPLLITPPEDRLSPYASGIVVDEPIVAVIEQAYIVLSGVGIVPEPGSLAMLCGSLCLLTAARH